MRTTAIKRYDCEVTGWILERKNTHLILLSHLDFQDEMDNGLMTWQKVLIGVFVAIIIGMIMTCFFCPQALKFCNPVLECFIGCVDCDCRD